MDLQAQPENLVNQAPQETRENRDVPEQLAVQALPASGESREKQDPRDPQDPWVHPESEDSEALQERGDHPERLGHRDRQAGPAPRDPLVPRENKEYEEDPDLPVPRVHQDPRAPVDREVNQALLERLEQEANPDLRVPQEGQDSPVAAEKGGQLVLLDLPALMVCQDCKVHRDRGEVLVRGVSLVKLGRPVLLDPWDLQDLWVQ